jgi:serine/threonine protein kinase
MFRPGDYLSELLTEGPPSARCELIRSLPSDDFGPRVLARRRSDDRALIVRGMAIADAAWARTSRRLEALAGVHDEHVTPLVAYGRHAGLAYFVHEHDGGPRLTSLLEARGGRLPLAALLPVFAQLLVAVGEAHRQGVVVGGVRPQDVRVITGDGDAVQIRLLDLGFASVLGVPAGRRGAVDHPSIYRAPEADVSAHPASDVFSLGVLFVRMLTGPLPRLATDAERIELLRSRLVQAHRDDPAFSDGLYTLLSEVVDPDLATRPRDVPRLLQALLEVVPASSLRLPNPAARHLEPFVAEDGAPCWPARQWTVLQSWDQPRRPTPTPARVAAAAARSAAPRARAVAASFTADASAAVPSIETEPSTETSAVSPTLLPMRHVVPRPAPRRPASRRRGFVGRVALGAAFLTTGAALGLAIAVGELGANAAPATAASIAVVGEAPAEPAPTGSTLVVETTPPGVLTVDGQRLGSTPYQASLPPGVHVVRVESPGRQSWRARIELAAGQSRHISVSLEPAIASTELARATAVAP